MEERKLPFIDWHLINVNNVTPKEENPDSEEQNLSLSLNTISSSFSTTSSTYDRKGKKQEEVHYEKLETLDFFFLEKSSGDSLSKPSETDAEIPLELPLFPFDHIMSTHTSTTTTTTDHKGKQAMMCTEIKSSSGFSSEPSDSDTVDDISLALSLSLNQSRGFEVGEGSNHHNLKQNNASITSNKKRRAMENPIPNKNKRKKVETVSTELTLAHDPWCIKKKLFKTDIGNCARLMLGSGSVEAHVFPLWSVDQLAQINQGFPVLVWDHDTNTEHKLKFMRWNDNANVLKHKWVPDFVKRRQLKEGDEIGLYWDIINARFNFTVLSTAQRQ